MKEASAFSVSSPNKEPVDFYRVPSPNGYLYAADGEAGVCMPTRPDKLYGVESVHATLFPAPCLLGCSFDPALVSAVGEAVGEECVSDGVGLLVAADVNVKRGAGEETAGLYGEDPLLSGTLGAAYVTGVQKKKVCAALKNYLFPRDKEAPFQTRIDLDERALRELYLRAYEVALSRCAPAAITLSPNYVRGARMAENAELLRILREEFNYKGAVIAPPLCADREKAYAAGVDLVMPCGERELALAASLKSLRSKEDIAPCDMEKHFEQSVLAAAESIVLLKNEGALPLTGRERLSVWGEERAGKSPRPYRSRSFAEALTDREIAFLRADGKSLANKENADVLLLWLNNADAGKESLPLARAYKESGAKVVALVHTPSAIDLPNVALYDAVFYTGRYGCGGGVALAALLYGDISPSGKAAESWCCPPEKYEEKGVWEYRESMFLGYRYAEAFDIPTLFPFGHGLSYTRFRYSSMLLSENLLREGGKLRLSFEVENTGERSGKEVVQLYVAPPKSGVYKPKKQLVAFVKVALAAGEKKRVLFELDESAFRYYDVERARYRLETGIYTLLAGASSKDLRLKREIQVFSADHRLPTSYEEVAPAFYGRKEPKFSAKEFRAIAGERKKRGKVDYTFGNLKNSNRRAYAQARAQASAVFVGQESKLLRLPLRLLETVNPTYYAQAVSKIKENKLNKNQKKGE